MRKLIIAAAGLAAAMIPAAASAQPGYRGQGYSQYGQGRGYDQGYNQSYGRGNDVARAMRECRRELRHADSRWEYQRELAECRREIARAQRRSHHGYGSHGNGYRDDDFDRRGDRRGW